MHAAAALRMALQVLAGTDPHDVYIPNLGPEVNHHLCSQYLEFR